MHSIQVRKTVYVVLLLSDQDFTKAYQKSVYVRNKEQ